jgi:LCP family protein required for cell wall assembly
MAVLTKKRRHNPRRRKVFIALMVLFVGLVSVGGVYAYRMVDAIVHAEKTAVYPLPTRRADVTFPTKEPPPQPTNTVAVPTATTDLLIPTATPNPFATPSATLAPQPTSTAQPQGTATAVPQLPTGDDTSHWDVVEGLWGQLSSTDPSTSSVWGGKTDLNILLLGVDRRPEGGDQNADVIIIAHVDLIDRKVAAVSIPRDLLVEIPGIGPDKINSAYNYGVKANPESKVAGVAMMRDTIEFVFQVPIDGYIMVDFNGFTEVIDAMGGVTVDVPETIVDTEFPTEDFGTETVRFTPGIQKLNGERALQYVRTRHQDSDDGRRERQLQILRALFGQAKSFGSITNGFEIITALGDSIQTSFWLEQQLTLAQLGYDMTDSDIKLLNLTEPMIWGGYTDAGAWVYFSDPVAVQQWVWDSLSTDNFSASMPASTTPISSPVSTPRAFNP